LAEAKIFGDGQTGLSCNHKKISRNHEKPKTLSLKHKKREAFPFFEKILRFEFEIKKLSSIRI